MCDYFPLTSSTNLIEKREQPKRWVRTADFNFYLPFYFSFFFVFALLLLLLLRPLLLFDLAPLAPQDGGPLEGFLSFLFLLLSFGISSCEPRDF
jgi:hypothetical protein